VPLTPFHLGPALTVKAAARRDVSLRTFALTQIVIDLDRKHTVTFLANSFEVTTRVGAAPMNRLNVMNFS
jgi:hypothetical protein